MLQMMVHKGFLDAYDSVKRVVFSLLDEITGSGEKGGPWRVLITGHSLGGALATLAAYELAERRYGKRYPNTDDEARVDLFSFLFGQYFSFMFNLMSIGFDPEACPHPLPFIIYGSPSP